MNEFYLGPVSGRAQLIAILGTLSLAVILIWLIRKGHLRAGYSLLWFLMVGAMLIFSLSPEALFALSNILGVYYAPAALFSVLVVILILISIHFSMVISRHEKRIKRLAQESALLKKRLEEQKPSSKVSLRRRSR